jgi:hypothetical protein
MKLYTEEQVREALRMTLGSLKISTENDIVNSLNPIYLPSDNDTQGSSIEWLIKQFETTEFYSEESKENVKEQAKEKYEHEMCLFADEYASYVQEQSKEGIKGAMVSMCAWTFFKNRRK